MQQSELMAGYDIDLRNLGSQVLIYLYFRAVLDDYKGNI